MTTNPSRRDVLTSTIAIAAGAALPSLGHVSSAMANPSLMSAAEIVAAIRDKKMTATDVAKAAFARAEQVKDLNALIIVNKDPALAAAAEIDLGNGLARCRSQAFPSSSRTTSIPRICRHPPARLRCRRRNPAPTRRRCKSS